MHCNILLSDERKGTCYKSVLKKVLIDIAYTAFTWHWLMSPVSVERSSEYTENINNNEDFTSMNKLNYTDFVTQNMYWEWI